MSNQRYLLLGVLAFGVAVWQLSFGVLPERDALSLEDAYLLDAIYAAPIETVEAHELRAGDHLGGILQRAGIGGSEMNNLLLALRQYANPRALPQGLEVRIRRWRDGGEPRAVEMHLNPDTTVILARDGLLGWEASVRLTPVTMDTVYFAGVIEPGGSLNASIMGDPTLDLSRADRHALVGLLANQVFGFVISFTQTQPGDTYRVMYEREVRPDGSTRRGRVLAAEVVNNGRVYPAIWFDDDDAAGYYDLDGESLQRTFLRDPIDARITSRFTNRRFHPILGVNRPHVGIDYGAPTGSPVRATANGTVVVAGRQGGYGNLIELRHADGYTTRYAHLSRFGAGIRAGRRVNQGETIGFVGATGLATGPHLHYELRRHGTPLNPHTVVLPPAPPIPQALREEFFHIRDARVALLDQAQSTGPALAEEDQEQQEG